MRENQKVESAKSNMAETAELNDSGAGGESYRSRKKKYGMIILLIVFFLLAGVAAILYYRGVVYYRTHFLPGTNINGIDCSNIETGPVVQQLDAGIHVYTLEVVGRDYGTGEPDAVLGTIASADIQLGFADTEEAVESLLQQQKELEWVMAYLGDGLSVSYSLEQNVVFDEQMLSEVVKSWKACRKENMRKAEDAYISGYSQESGRYEIVPETLSTELDVEKAITIIADAVYSQEGIVDLQTQDCYREADIRQDDRKLTSIVDTVNKWLGTRIDYDWNGTEVILDNEILKDWISIESGTPALDEEAVAAFVKGQAAEYDTYGKRKNFVTTLGVEVNLSSRNYGWKTDTASETEELLLRIYQGSVEDREPVYSITAMQKGTDDVGGSYVEADLTNQHLYLYQDGEIVLETDFVSGTMISTYDCVTPEGIYGLLYKTRNAVLKGATYRTPVSYWMPFYGNYGMHDAKWRGAFGGEIYKTNGSHGCINLPPSMAEQIYQYVAEGFPVVCYYYDGAPYIGLHAAPEEGESEEGYDESDWEEPDWEEPEETWEEPAPSAPEEVVEPLPEDDFTE